MRIGPEQLNIRGRVPILTIHHLKYLRLGALHVPLVYIPEQAGYLR